MIKFLTSLTCALCLTVIAGCSSPPKPPKLQSTDYQSLGSEALYAQNDDNAIIPNQAIKSAGNFGYIVNMVIGAHTLDAIPDASKLKFMFLVAHSDTIRIAGDSVNVAQFKRELTDIGTTARIETVDVLANTDGYLNFTFIKN